MPWTYRHLDWLVDTGKRLATADGKEVQVWEFRHKNDDGILTSWVRHFRNHYCLDTEIDSLRKGYGHSRGDYLRQIKFPDASSAPGPSIRAGDFAEILVADYLEYTLKYWVPRTRWNCRTVRNESAKGCDIMGFKILGNGADSPEDVLAIFEVKAQFSGVKARARLQDAVDGSARDPIRKGESLNAIKQRLLDKQQLEDAQRVERFQNTEDRPFKEVFGAAALFSTSVFDEASIAATKANGHPAPKNLVLLVIHGNDMMKLVHELYKRAADEA
jgi:hypothetical protein